MQINEERLKLAKSILDDAGVNIDDLFQFYDIKQLFLVVLKNPLPNGLMQRAVEMLIRLYYAAKKGAYSSEFETIYAYINWITKIPWGKYTEDTIDVARVEAELNKTHYGLAKVKERILTYIAALKMRSDRTHKENNKRVLLKNIPVLLFVGLQGLGKTTIAKSIARALSRPFVKISLAAFGDISQLRGRPKGYPDAEPGVIVKALVQAGVMNPLILLDEIDKISSDEKVRNDAYSAFLEIFDPSQNESFVDRYIDWPIDLSYVFFIATANTTGTMTAPVLDRMEIIRFTSYSDDEKIKIARDYLLPKVLHKVGLRPEELVIDAEVWPMIVRPMGFDAGIRQLERILMNLARKVAYKITRGELGKVHINKENIKDYIIADMGYVG